MFTAGLLIVCGFLALIIAVLSCIDFIIVNWSGTVCEQIRAVWRAQTIRVLRKSLSAIVWFVLLAVLALTCVNFYVSISNAR